MKKTDCKTTMTDVLLFLLDGPKYADDIGAHFWPDKVGYGPARGGPSSVAVAASYLLGRLRAKGYVEQTWNRHYSNYKQWSLTDEGHAYLRNNLTPTSQRH